jgi:hypothetical protein
MQLSVYKKFNGRTVRGKTQGYIGQKKKKEGPDKKSRNQRLGES